MSLYSTCAWPIIPALCHLFRICIAAAAGRAGVRLEPADPAGRPRRVGPGALREQRQCPLPAAAGPLGVSRLDLDVAEVQQRARLVLRVTGLPVQLMGLLVAGDRLPVVAELAVDVGDAVERIRGAGPAARLPV